MCSLPRLAVLSALPLFMACIDGCTKKAPMELVAPAPTVLGRYVIPLDDYVGISGIVSTGENAYLLVPERQGVVIPLLLQEGSLKVGEAQALENPVEFESLAQLADGRIALGGETQSSRVFDSIQLYTMNEGQWKASEQWTFDYQPFDLVAEQNRGLEGLCTAQNYLLASSEQVIDQDDGRFAPLALTQNGEQWSRFVLPLTSESGKLSSLDCTLDATGQNLTVYAIERHYEVCRILKASLPVGPSSDVQTLSVEIIADLSHIEALPNLESLHRRPDGNFVLVSDNHMGSRQGDTELLLVQVAEP